MQRLVMLIGSTCLLAACQKPVEPPAPPRPALMITAGASGSETAMGLVGEIRPRYESAQGFRIAGKVVERKVEVGAAVHKGQVLARLDAVDTGLNAEAKMADVHAAEAERALAEAELERQRQLFARKFISRSALDIRESEYKTSTAKLEQARSQAAVSGNQSRYTSLVADRDGVITEIHAEPGQVVAAGDVVAKIADLKQMEAMVAVPESRMVGIKVGEAAIVRLWASREKIYQGKIREISPAADSATRTFQVKVTMPDADENVRLGMTAGVRFANLQETGSLLPTQAVTQRDGKTIIWIFDPKTQQVQPRPVIIGPFREDGVLVTSGLNAGEQVVSAGVHTLVAGQKVRPLQSEVMP